MPDLTLTFTDPQAARIKAAFGVSTAAEMKARIRAWVRATVEAAERAEAQQAATDALDPFEEAT